MPIAAQTVVSTDFSQATVKTYTSGDIVGPAGDPTAQLTANSGTYEGTTGQWSPDSGGTNPQVKVVEVEGKNVLQLCEGSAISKSIPDAIANKSSLQLQGTIVFTPLPSAAPARSPVLFLLTKDSWFTTGGANLLSLVLSGSFALTYPGGAVPQTLSPGVKYRIDFTLDGSDLQQHTWGFVLYEGDGTDKPLFTSPKLNTRNPTGAPNTFVIHQYADATTPNPDPLIDIEKVSLSVAGQNAAASSPTPK